MNIVVILFLYVLGLFNDCGLNLIVLRGEIDRDLKYNFFGIKRI